MRRDRSNASNKTTILLHQGETRTVVVNVAAPGAVELRLLYSNDGPGTTDQVEIKVNNQARLVNLPDTRGSDAAGQGWNNIATVGPIAPTVSLVAGDNEVALTVTTADNFGVELDALLVFLIESPEPPPGSTVNVTTVPELLAALRRAAAGTTIHMVAGTYIVTETIVVARDDVTIEGDGDATIVQLANNVRCPVILVGEPAPFAPTITHRGVALKSMRIRGYKFANPTPQDELCSVPGREFLRNNCVTLRQVESCRVESVTVENAASGGIVLEQMCRNIEIASVTSFENEYDGMAWDGDIQNSRVSGGVFHDNGAAGLSLDIGPANNQFDACTIRNNATVGVFLRDSDRNCFTNCTLEANGQDGVFIADGDRLGADAAGNAFVNNHYIGNGRNGIWQSGEHSSGNCESGGTFARNAGDAKFESFPAGAPLEYCGTVQACSP